MNKMEYVVVSRTGLVSFESAVKKHVENGWKPLGGVCVVAGSGLNHEFFQAFTRDVKDDNIEEQSW